MVKKTPKNRVRRELRVALVHDVFIEHGGAERVVLELLALYPGADVFVPLVTPAAKELLIAWGARRVFSSAFNAVPFIHSASILLKPFLFWYWESLDLGEYDLVISSSHSFSAKAVITGPETLHLSYIHTPPRYLYAEFNETRVLKHPVMRVVLAPLLAWLRHQDFLAAQRPDILVANSQEVQRRISKYYRRDSVVVYPPVKIPRSLKQKSSRQKPYYICFSRLAKQKGILLAVQACTRLNRPLKIIGEGSELATLQQTAGPTVEFLGRVPDEQLPAIFAGAQALIYPALEEDFGMAPVEVMGHGVPVVAHRSGGVQESVVAGKTGIFFDEWSVDGVVTAIQAFEQQQFSAAQCRRQAQHFSTSVFRRKLARLVETHLRKHSLRQ